MFHRIILNTPPRTLFLIDGLGALLTAFMSGVILERWQPLFGMPERVLYILAAIALVFSAYSLINYWRFGGRWRVFMRGIALANLLYCIATIFLVILFREQLTGLGIAYFIIEAIVVLILVRLEIGASH